MRRPSEPFALLTRDRDFSLFPELKTRDPASVENLGVAA